MKIARLQVEEGFLDGLDLRLADGLNVLIGARGTGKTSVIELLRFALGVPNLDAQAAADSKNHALAVLDTGRVIVTIGEGENETIIIRSASDSSPQTIPESSKPVILSQTEIETLGMHSDGRLRLLDGFISKQSAVNSLSDTQIIRSLTAQISGDLQELEFLQADIDQIAKFEEELASLSAHEASLAAASADLAQKNEALKRETEIIGRLAVAHDDLSRAAQLNDQRIVATEGVLATWGSEDRSLKTSETLAALADDSAKARIAVLSASTTLQVIRVRIIELRDKVEKNRVTVEQRARTIRQEVESLSEGAGKVAARSLEVQKVLARARSLIPLAASRTANVARLKKQRAEALDRLEQENEDRYRKRIAAADRLNERLGPRIKVTVERSGQAEPYAAMIANVLRGSGLRYNELSRELSLTVSPRELAEWAEDMDAHSLHAATGMPLERAVKCLTAFQAFDLAKVMSFQVDDKVDFYLFDHSSYKPINTLSMGQRCTVVLPIILENEGRGLIIDQPEDHIDNAFIADTLIKGIRDRAATDQLIVTTHNANIPVLGEAAMVAQMSSDGQRGYVQVANCLDDQAVVDAISAIMEGGRDAFAKRAEFYARD
jgi:energy-coupling factor transporter ATP-binding protein EcfA2